MVSMGEIIVIEGRCQVGEGVLFYVISAGLSRRIVPLVLEE